MKVLFVSSGIQVKINPIIENQGESLKKAGVDVEYYVLSGRGWKNYVRNLKPLREKMKSGNYDLIHAHYALTAYLASIASMGLGIPMVVSLMGNDILDHWWYPVLARTVAKYKPWKAVIVKSQEMKERVGMDYANVIPNGVNMERFSPKSKVDSQKSIGWDPEKKHVLFPGAPWDVRKNWKMAEAAVALLQSDLRFKIDDLRFANGIELHGMDGVKNEDTAIWYNAADAVVLPSFYEGSPNAVKEAMACNTPVVATDMGDCVERMDGVEGCSVIARGEWVFPKGNWGIEKERWDRYLQELAEGLKKAFEHGKIKGRERLLEDGIADYQIAERIVKIYQKILKV